jgi:hypothetical protein
MAERLQIEGNVLVVFEDGTPSNEYIRAKRSTTVPKYDENDILRFKDQTGFLGDGQIEFDTATIIDDITGLPFTSLTYLKEFLSVNLSSDCCEFIPISAGLVNQIIVTQSNYTTTIGGTIDSTKEYFLDGVIDLGTTQITVPSGGITIRGYSFVLSGLVSTENSYDMFISPVGGSGDILIFDLLFTASGTSSKVYELTDSDGFHAIEISRVNYIDCSSLGNIYNYRQGLESGTGRFGGSPSLTLNGTWLGGFTIRTSIVRGMSDVTTEPLFKAGTLFSMTSRFVTNMNVDLGTLQPLLDFSTANFVNPSTLQLKEMEVTRDGVYDANDINITPNINATDIAASWVGNNGIDNTHVGGFLEIDTEITTAIGVQDTFYVLAGTYISSDLQHFDVPLNGQLRHIGNTPRDFKINCYVVLDGTQNEIIIIRVRKYDDSTGLTSTVISQQATVNNFQGGNDRCTLTILGRTTLDLNDYLFSEVANTSSAADVTALIGTYATVEER